MNANEKKHDNLNYNKMNNNSNLNLVTEHSQKNFGVINNRKFNMKNYDDLEDSLA